MATGETWFGEQAVEKGLCDALMTADDYLLKLADAGAEVFSIRYAPPPKAPSLAALSASAASAATSVGVEAGALGGLRGALGSWLLSGAAPQPQGPGYYVADPMAGAERADSGVGGVGVDEWPDGKDCGVLSIVSSSQSAWPARTLRLRNPMRGAAPTCGADAV